VHPCIMGSSVDLLADALNEVRSNLKAQVDSASVLVHEVELAERLIVEGRAQLRLLHETLAKTAELKESIRTQRELLAELRSTLAEILVDPSADVPVGREP
jgi:hypothetical protein